MSDGTELQCLTGFENKSTIFVYHSGVNDKTLPQMLHTVFNADVH